MNQVIWVPSALDDLKEIQKYIARDSLYYANKFIEGAFNATERLSSFPKSGRIVPEFGNPAIREIGHGSYRIIYELINEAIYVVAVVHGKRLLPDDIF
jgi:plasmid stabilization system protein ParE